MKKTLALILALCMLLSLLAGCRQEPAETTGGTEPPQSTAPVVATTAPVEKNSLADVIAYLQSLYEFEDTVTAADYSRVASVTVGEQEYAVAWATDVSEELVKIVPADDGTFTVDVCETAAVEMPYVLTATVTAPDGTSESVSWNYTLPAAPADQTAIVDAAYALEDGVSMAQPVTLTGLLTEIRTPWSEDYQNISVVLTVEGREDKPILCFRLKGDGAKTLAVGDTITVTGTIKNYGGTIEFDAGCTLDSVISGGGEAPVTPETEAEIVEAAYRLKSGESLPYEATLTGQIASVDYAWSDQYENITVTMWVCGRKIQCYRLKGEGAKYLGVNDVITVKGTLTNYSGTIEFGSGCKLLKVVKGNAPTAPSDPHAIIDAAYNLKDYESLPYSCSLTGVISSVDYAWSDQYGNITVTIKVAGRESKPIQCYRLKGEGAKDLAVGDTITVKGTLKNYMGTIEFDSGCTLTNVVKGEKQEAPSDPLAIIDAAYQLKDYESLPYSCTLTGKISQIDSPWDESYGNISVTIQVPGREDKPILCYRLKGEGADTLAVGDTVTVTGTIKNYMNTIEFGSGCTLDAVVKGEEAPEEPEVPETPEEPEVPETPEEPEVPETPEEPEVPETPEEPVIPTDPAKIIDAAYALAEGEQLDYTSTLTGKVVRIDDPYSEQYKNITVTMEVEGSEDQPIVCFRVKGEGADTLAVGDTITVTGVLMNYGGTIEFGSGCTLDAIVKGEGTPEEPEIPETPEDPEEPAIPTDPAAIIDAAYALEVGAQLSYSSTLTGKITEIRDPYSSQYKNISVTVVVEGSEDQPIVCYRLKGEGADTLAVGDTVTVTGTLMNYNGLIEFAAGCSLDAVVKGDGGEEIDIPTDPAEIIDAAYALEDGKKLPYYATLTGTVTEIGDAYSEQYKNITVTIVVAGSEDQPIVCYRLKGEGADALAVGDTVTVTGVLMNYGGTIEFGSGCTIDSIG